jgi:Mg2+-importing ATPase
MQVFERIQRPLGVPSPPANALAAPVDSYWAVGALDLARRLGSTPDGLTSAEAEARLRTYGPNELGKQRHVSRLTILLAQVRSPLLWLLAFAAIVSALSGEWTDAIIVFVILGASVALGYSREYSAETAVAALRARVRTRACVLRDGRSQAVDLSQIVPGDVVLLSAGALVPADAVLLDASDCFASEAMLTGESFPAAKSPGIVRADAPLARRTNVVFLGTSVRSGNARCLVVATGAATAFGAIAERLTLRPPETEFDRGVRRFGYLLTGAMSVLVLLVFAAHVVRGRPPIETLLFAIALAVGLSPELLPAILSVNLARGAQAMARRKVLVRRLNAIENLGSMTVLCTDKTGTLTEGVVLLEGAYDAEGQASRGVLELAACNAELTAGIANPLDEAILRAHGEPVSPAHKLGEIPFDFVRKRVSVVVSEGDGARLIAKGAFGSILSTCTHLENGAPLDDTRRAGLEQRYRTWSDQGTRVIAIATRPLPKRGSYGRDDERDLAFCGFLAFLDRPKEGAREAIAELATLGVAVKLITGDAKRVAQHVAQLVGLGSEHVLTGADLDQMHDEALWREAERTDLFVEVDPNQKERIILALKKMGHVVGFLGDGANDAPAMHAADTSISVEHAVDVAREAADFVLLERHLDVIRGGIEEGRKTFANTLKYVCMTTSANLGNMLSMALASLLLPFLPLTAGQILLNNLLSDVPAIGLADDAVDPELVQQPRRWDTRFIGPFMVEFGVLSSAFDLLTFALLRRGFGAGPELFRTGWFLESLLTELVVALVVRTRRPFWHSRPGRLLLASTVALVAVAFAVPYVPGASVFGFVPLPLGVLAALMLITIAYVSAAELMKRWFYHRGSDVHSEPAITLAHGAPFMGRSKR